MSRWTQGLNPEQAEAVQHTRGPLLILAGAGSGKTTVLVSRTGHILESGAAKAKDLCVLTFTNKAARELKHRVGVKIGAQAKDLWTGTFHSFGLQLLRRFHKEAGLPSHFGIVDSSDADGILKELLSNIRNSAKETFKADKLLSIMGAWREVGRKKAQNPSDEYEVMAEVLLPKYLRRLESLGVVDFEGLLLKPLELFKSHPEILARMQEAFQHVMVDEFQDTNRTQFRLVQALVMNHMNIAVVGDDDQSIYGWRGACVSNILDFPKSFQQCRVIRLERNYRSTPAILSLANNIIEKNTARHGKVLRPDPQAQAGAKPELFVYDNDDIEIEEVVSHIRHFRDQEIPNDQIAVLYRSNGQGGLLEGALRQNNIPYSITGGMGFFDRKETKDVLAYLRTALNPNEVSFRRIINTPSRGIGDGTVERLAEFAAEKNAAAQHLPKGKSLGFLSAARDWRGAGIAEKIGVHIDELFSLLAGLPDELLGNGQPAVPGESAGVRLVKFLDRIGYRAHLRAAVKDDAALAKRWMAMEILGRIMDGFLERGGATRESLREFVDAMELRDPGEGLDRDQTPKVQLLTLHACKGLEFRAVVLMGLEEDLLPHRTLGEDVAEERRLFYVGVTRARERLVLTRARARKRFGRLAPVTPSRFLEDIRPDLLERFESGFRPVGEEQRKTLLSDLFKKLEVSIATQKVER
ncbi:MAG: ATP-dependent helicase [Bdellovibrionaceae bacterium]|nr:ATP-dependent helicase [Pseudobdellovibrionaceae bacterium]